MVARWISHLQPFDFAIVHCPGKHHNHADGLSRRSSRPCKRDTCAGCKPLQKAVTTESEAARCFTPAFPYQHQFDGYIEMSEEDAALFWKIDADSNSAPQRESANPAPDSTEATPVEGLCLGTMRLPAPVTDLNAPAVDCSTAKAASTDTAQDTKPAAQPHATSTMDAIEIQKPDTAIQRLHQVTFGTQTEGVNSLPKRETTENPLGRHSQPDLRDGRPDKESEFGDTYVPLWQSCAAAGDLCAIRPCIRPAASHRRAKQSVSRSPEGYAGVKKYTGRRDFEPEGDTIRGCSLDHTNGDYVFRSNPAQRHLNETKRSEKGQSRDPCGGYVYRDRLMDCIALHAAHMEIDSSFESRHLCRRC